MAQKLVLLFFILIVQFQAVTQNKAVDSMRSVLTQNPSKETEGIIYANLSYEFLKDDKFIDSAYFYAVKANNLATENDYYNVKIASAFNIGRIYSLVGQFEKATHFYKLALKDARKLKNDPYLSAIINNLGDIHLEKKNFKKATVYFKDALQLAKDSNNKSLESLEYANLGTIAFETGKLDQAETYFLKSRRLYDSLNIAYPLYWELTKTYLAQKRYNDAENEALNGLSKVALNTFSTDNNAEYNYNLAISLSEIYMQMGNVEKSTDYIKKAIVYRKKIENISIKNKLEQVELKQKLREQQLLLAQLEEKNKYQSIISVIGIVVLVLFVLLIFRQRKIVKMTREIHNIQHQFIKTELDKRNFKNKSALAEMKKKDDDFLKRR